MFTFGRTSGARASLLNRAVRLCLVVSLWPAPAPWVHCHEDEESPGPQLTQHLNEYHAHQGADCHEGWHLHFAYLWELAGDTPCPDDQKEPPPCQRPATPVASSPEIGLTPPSVAEPSYAVVLEAQTTVQVTNREVVRHYVCPGGFLNSFAGVIAPHQLLGVLLC
jgi:hypothetical protein